MYLRALLKWLIAVGFATAAAALNAEPNDSEFEDPLYTPAPLNTLATTSHLNGVARAGDRLVAVGRRGLAILSDDGGETWRQVQLPTSVDLTAVYFATEREGWAVGHGGVLLQTTDAGESWIKRLDGNDIGALLLAHYQRRAEAGHAEAERVLPDAEFLAEDPTTNPLLGVWFKDKDVGYIVGAFNLILKTTDGGQTWVPWLDRTDNPWGDHLYAIDGMGQTVYIAGERGRLLRLSPDGRHFVAVETSYEGSFFGVAVASDAVVAYGLRGAVFSSQDGGETWVEKNREGNASVTGDMVLPDGRIMLATMGGTLLISQDRGRTFETKSTEPPLPWSGIAQGKGNEVVLVGPAGVAEQPL